MSATQPNVIYYFQLNWNLSLLDKEKLNNRWLCNAVPVQNTQTKIKNLKKVGSLHKILLKVALKVPTNLLRGVIGFDWKYS